LAQNRRITQDFSYPDFLRSLPPGLLAHPQSYSDQSSFLRSCDARATSSYAHRGGTLLLKPHQRATIPAEAMSKRKRCGSAVDPDYDLTWGDEEQLADNEKPSVLANLFAGFDEAKLAQIKNAAPPGSETPAEAGLSRLGRMVEARAEKRAAAAGCESGEIRGHRRIQPCFGRRIQT
jgi:hypothetical protein